MKNTISGLAFLLLLFLMACGPTDQSKQEEGAEETAEATATEEAAPAEDKSNRPSPPKEASGQIAGADILINYSSPAVKGRKIWGGLEAYGAVWRTGANEATTIEFSKAVTIEGKTLAAGKYALFSIPNEDKWVIIFNTDTEQWGATNYDESKDALRVEVKPKNLDQQVERMEFEVAAEGVALRWDKIEVSFKVGAAG